MSLRFTSRELRSAPPGGSRGIAIRGIHRTSPKYGAIRAQAVLPGTLKIPQAGDLHPASTGVRSARFVIAVCRSTGRNS